MASEQHPDWRADLNEHNLYYYVTNGPSQLTRGLDSPMLELAHERQFAISQLGTRSVGFEVEHSARVQSALRMLETRFRTHFTDHLCRPTSPHAEVLVDLRTQTQSFTPLPALDLFQHSRSISTPTATNLSAATTYAVPSSFTRTYESCPVAFVNFEKKGITGLQSDHPG